MAQTAADLVALLPATGEVSFDSWKQSVQTAMGRPMGNRLFNQVRASGAVTIKKNPATGVLMIGRKVVTP
jgi:hypothetical protein